jgi:hypothetical protein
MHGDVGSRGVGGSYSDTLAPIISIAPKKYLLFWQFYSFFEKESGPMQ